MPYVETATHCFWVEADSKAVWVECLEIASGFAYRKGFKTFGKAIEYVNQRTA